MTRQAVQSPNIKTIALPAQHGGWGFLFEPILLGMFVAASWAGLGISIAAFGAFLIHQPLKLTVKDRRKDKRYARTILAERFVIGYGLLALIGVILAILTAKHDFYLPLLGAIPLGIIQLLYEFQNDGRSATAEIAGAVAFGAVAAMIALAAGWETIPALMLWLMLAIRAFVSIFYVRSRLRLEKDKPANIPQTLAIHAAGLILYILLVLMDHAPWTVIVVGGILLARAAYGLSDYRKRVSTKVIGFSEIGYGIFTILMITVGIP